MRLLAILALAVLAAGCAGPGGSDGGADGSNGSTTADVDAGPQPSTQEFTFTLGGGIGTPLLGQVLPLDDENLLPFDVAEGYSTLVATVEWQCDNPALCDLEVELRRGNQDIVTGDYGGSPLTLSVDDPQAGRYTFAAFPDSGGSVVLGMQGTLTVELS